MGKNAEKKHEAQQLLPKNNANVIAKYRGRLKPRQSPVFQRNASDPEEFDFDAGQTWIYPTNLPVRDYQFSIVKEALFKNTLVVLPTGLGKTFIAAVVMFNIYRWYPKGKIVFMAPTRPLVAQQIEACFKVTGIPQEDTTQMTGTNVSEQRKLMWQKKRVFFLTPQVLANDLVRNICPAASIKCVVVDEAHKALGNHSYCQVIRELCSFTTNFRVLALTATPGSETQSVKQVLSNLLISHVEMRTEDSEDVKQYSHIRDTEKIVVPLGEALSNLKGKFLDIIHNYLKRLQRRNAMGPKNPSSLSKFQMLKLREAFSQQPPSAISRHEYGLIMADFSLCISLYHAFELLLLHGTRSFYNFLIGIVNGEKSIPHARSELSKNFCFEEVMQEIKEKYIGDSVGTSHVSALFLRLLPSHPKLVKLQEIVLEHFRVLEADNVQQTRVMIFSQYRDSVQEITELLSRHEPVIKVMSFLGQAAKVGSSTAFTQKLQLQVIEKFRTGGYNTLVATCVGEEGLDIGEVDLIVCYDCPKSPIRLVQRMGRTGRFRKGRIIILLSEGKEEQTYKTCEYQKKSINQAIKKGFSGAQLYQNNPSLVPNGVKPVCVKKNVEIEVKKIPTKKKQNKATAYLNEEEKTEYDACFKVPQNDQPLLPSSEMVSLKPQKQVLQSGSSLHQQNDSQLSFSKWILWQTTPQRTHFVSHSRQTSTLVEIMELIETSSENIPKFDLSPKMLDKLYPTKKCGTGVYNGSNSNNVPLYDYENMLLEEDSDVICLGSEQNSLLEQEVIQRTSFSLNSEKFSPKDNLLKRLFVFDSLEACEAISFDLDFDFPDEILESSKVPNFDHGKTATSPSCLARETKTPQVDNTLKTNNSKDVSTILKQFSSSKQDNSPNLDTSFSQTLKVKKVVMENDVVCTSSFRAEKNQDFCVNEFDNPKSSEINIFSSTNPYKSAFGSSFNNDCKKRTLNTSVGATQCTLTQLVDMINSTGHLEKNNQILESEALSESPKSNAPSSSDDEIAPTPPKNSQKLQRIIKSVPNFDCRHLLKRSTSVSECSSKDEKPQKSETEVGHGSLPQLPSVFECNNDEKFSNNEQDKLPAIKEADLGATQKLEFDISFDFFTSPLPSEADCLQENICDNTKSEVFPQTFHKSELQCLNEPNVMSPESNDNTTIRPGVVQQVRKEESLRALSTEDNSPEVPNAFPESDAEEYNLDNLPSQSILQSSTIGSPVKNCFPKRNLSRENILDDSLFKVPEPRAFLASSRICKDSVSSVTNNIKELVPDIPSSSKRRFIDNDDSDDDFQFVKKLKTTSSKSDDSHSDKKVNSKSAKSKKRKRNKFLLTQADVSEPDSSEEEFSANEDMLDDSFIDDGTLSQQNDTDQHALYLRSIKGFAGLPQNYKLKFLEPRNDSGATETIYDDSNYEFDSFCVGDNDVEYLSSENDKTPERRKTGMKRFKRIRTMDSSSSNDETSPKKSFKLTGGEERCFNDDSVTSKNISNTLRRSAKGAENPQENSVNKAMEKCIYSEKFSSKLARKVFLNKTAAVVRNNTAPQNAAASNMFPDYCRNIQNNVTYNDNHSIPPEFADEVMCFDLENLDENLSEFEGIESFGAEKNNQEERKFAMDKINVNEDVPHKDSDEVMCFDLENLSEFEDIEHFAIEKNKQGKREISKNQINVKSSKKKLFSEDALHKDTDEVMCFDLENFDENILDLRNSESFGTERNQQLEKEAPVKFTEKEKCGGVVHKDDSEANKRNPNSALENCNEVPFDDVWNHPASFCFGFDEAADSAVASKSTTESKNNPRNIPILVDSRELASGKPVISLLRNKFGINPVVMHLTSADYVISSRLAIERVLDSEFLNQQMPPRIIEKIKIMQEMYEKITVVIEKDNRKQRLSFSKNDTKYLSFSLNVCWHENTNILCSISPEHTAELLFSLVQKEMKRNLHISVPTVINSRNQDLYNFYSSFPLVSPICAFNFMYNFPVLRMFFESSAHEIKKAGLISSKRALKIFNYLRSEYFHIDS
ncbi:Fanconi anemia group M protein-like [Uloborus diversus]|uniref:Fanconi anemia group M protein-like n=1 Tax=Uloborus diversus TaxID=327109 RepID=UPI0024096169|nr:Fanconi anemia group M protein-like [Uloborus diversus]